MTDGAPRRGLTRRGALVLTGAGLLGAAGIVGGGLVVGNMVSGPEGTITPERRDRPVAVDKAVLRERTEVAGAAHVYEPDGERSPWWATPDFGARMDRWLRMHVGATGQRVDAIRSYGAWVPGAGKLWHSAGRAFDIAALNSGGRAVVSARYDLWRGESPAILARRQRDYWRLVAGLHVEFADVLTYLYDPAHANHIHVDTGRFGEDGPPRFIERSKVQNQSVQAMLVHVWGRRDVEITGRYDDATRRAATEVIRSHGRAELGALDPEKVELVDGVEAWRAFMLSTLRRGSV